jgi:hypothetical protein
MKRTNMLVLVIMNLAATLLANDYTIKSGDYQIKLNDRLCHTVRSISYKGYLIGTQNGYYGTVMAPRSGKYIGAGHKEGGSEKVIWIKLTCDGKEFSPQNQAFIQGHKIIIEKISQFDQALFRTRLELTPNGLIEQKRFVTLASQKFNNLYSNLFCWNKATTNWYALTAKGVEVAGEFTHKKVLWHLMKDIRWTAVYDSKAQKGIMLYYPEIVKGKGRKACYWEVPRAYNKFYMMTKVPAQCSKGWKSPVYTVIVRGFSSSNAKDCPVVLKKESAFLKNYSIPKLGLPTLK